ncbi:MULTISPECIES: glycosyltransferase family 4 protein [unclassified Synechococcus]|uniref:glycosyltransferase family 4 protein n=1 Tax=Synechococcales TaxID=1890424 RepID=UPI00162425CF|nr:MULTISPECIES: glycosyltransferase family 4 protein [unclassified Synechococcus]
MASVPTSWAQISFANLKGFAFRAQAKTAETLTRLTAAGGTILIVTESEQYKSLLARHAFLENYSSFGLEFFQSGTILATFTKVSRSPEQPALPTIDTSDTRISYDLHTLLPFINSAWLHQRPNPTSNDSSWDSQKQSARASAESEIQALQNLADQKINEYQQREVYLLKENEEARGSIEDLHAKLAEMTASFLSMQKSLHDIIKSRAWKATEWPRRAIDAAKLAKHRLAAKRSFTSQAADQKSAANNINVSTFDYLSIPVQSPPVNTTKETLKKSTTESSYLNPIWTGTFLDIDDNSTNSGRQRCKRILFIDWRLPEPDKDSGSCRMHEILKIATSTGKPVDFAGNENSAEQKYLDIMLELGIHPILGRESIVRHLRKFGSQYSVIIICRPEPAAYYAPLARCYCPQARLVFDTVDLHFLRYYRAQALAEDNSEEKQQFATLHLRHFATEKFLAEVCDSTIVVTDEEKVLLSEFIDPSRIEVIPNIHSIPLQDEIPGFQDRQGLLFIGGFDHAPNADAVIYFSEQILPLVKKILPDIILYIVGSNMKDNIAKLSSDNIKPIGYVEDLTTIYNQVRAFIAPLRYGAGLKGKVGQSMSYGVPVVGTSVAFEGFGVIDRKQGLIANSPEEFAAAVVEVYSHPELWQTISEDGQKLVESRFSSNSAQTVIDRVIGDD